MHRVDVRVVKDRLPHLFAAANGVVSDSEVIALLNEYHADVLRTGRRIKSLVRAKKGPGDDASADGQSSVSGAGHGLEAAPVDKDGINSKGVRPRGSNSSKRRKSLPRHSTAWHADAGSSCSVDPEALFPGRPAFDTLEGLLFDYDLAQALALFQHMQAEDPDPTAFPARELRGLHSAILYTRDPPRLFPLEGLPTATDLSDLAKKRPEVFLAGILRPIGWSAGDADDTPAKSGDGSRVKFPAVVHIPVESWNPILSDAEGDQSGVHLLTSLLEVVVVDAHPVYDRLLASARARLGMATAVVSFLDSARRTEAGGDDAMDDGTDEEAEDRPGGLAKDIRGSERCDDEASSKGDESPNPQPSAELQWDALMAHVAERCDVHTLEGLDLEFCLDMVKYYDDTESEYTISEELPLLQSAPALAMAGKRLRLKLVKSRPKKRAVRGEAPKSLTTPLVHNMFAMLEGFAEALTGSSASRSGRKLPSWEEVLGEKDSILLHTVPGTIKRRKRGVVTCLRMNNRQTGEVAFEIRLGDGVLLNNLPPPSRPEIDKGFEVEQSIARGGCPLPVFAVIGIKSDRKSSVLPKLLCRRLLRNCETYLGAAGSPHELFASRYTCTIDIASVTKLVRLHVWTCESEWREHGAQQSGDPLFGLPKEQADDLREKRGFVVRKLFMDHDQHLAFLQLPPMLLRDEWGALDSEGPRAPTPLVTFNEKKEVITSQGHRIQPGDAVLLLPKHTASSSPLRDFYPRIVGLKHDAEELDQLLQPAKYTEMWRKCPKAKFRIKLAKSPYPLSPLVARVLALENIENPEAVELRVRAYIRPEDTAFGPRESRSRSPFEVFATERTFTVPLADVVGLCIVRDKAAFLADIERLSLGIPLDGCCSMALDVPVFYCDHAYAETSKAIANATALVKQRHKAVLAKFTELGAQSRTDMAGITAAALAKEAEAAPADSGADSGAGDGRAHEGESSPSPAPVERWDEETPDAETLAVLELCSLRPVRTTGLKAVVTAEEVSMRHTTSGAEMQRLLSTLQSVDWGRRDPLNRVTGPQSLDGEWNGKISGPFRRWSPKWKAGAGAVLEPPLPTIDLFSGAGGLSEGLHQSGLSRSVLAVEFEAAAAEAFRANFPTTQVMCADVGRVLRAAMETYRAHGTSRRAEVDGNLLPIPGEVGLICGGPPCQGYSGMNRFSSGSNSKMKNSLVATFLGFVDLYRPAVAIMENVRTMSTVAKSTVIRACVASLLAMGYSCHFGILQAATFGVPQSRRRLILVATAPGLDLPVFPRAKFAFVGGTLAVNLGPWRFQPAGDTSLAPYRKVLAGEAFGGLPPLDSLVPQPSSVPLGESTDVGHFVNDLRGAVDPRVRRAVHGLVHDHEVRVLDPLAFARVGSLPRRPDVDWRNLPNSVVRLPDGTVTAKLAYTHLDSYCGHKLGVCRCSSMPPEERSRGNRAGQIVHDTVKRTMIPWCLPHTAARNNQWRGLYGRVNPWGSFGTCVADLQVMGKQGTVVHSHENRLLSIREVSRAQGFPDGFALAGTASQRYRQAGNAVPPPLARALGEEIGECLFESRTACIGFRPRQVEFDNQGGRTSGEGTPVAAEGGGTGSERGRRYNGAGRQSGRLVESDDSDADDDDDDAAFVEAA